MKKRLCFISNSSSQSFIISRKVNTNPQEVYNYLEGLLLRFKDEYQEYNKEEIKKRMIVKYYKDLTCDEKWIIDNWYKEDPKKHWWGLGENYEFDPNTIIVYIDDSYWIGSDTNAGWYKLKTIRKKYKIKNKFFSMHMG